jgi:hypothetical protein
MRGMLFPSKVDVVTVANDATPATSAPAEAAPLADASAGTPATPAGPGTPSPDTPAPPTTPPAPVLGASATPANPPATPDTPSAAALAAAAAPDVAEPNPGTDRPRPVRDAVASRIEAREEARAEARAAHSGPTRVAIDTSGDPALTIPAEALIEEKLSAAGMEVVSSTRSADVVVRVSTQIIGNQDIAFYGQNAVLTTAYLTVKPFAGGRALGPGLRQKIDYTPMSAEAKVQEALGPGLDRVVSSAREGR